MDSGKDALAPGSAFGRYSIVRKIGAGGMGTVYEAKHLELKKRVAIKTLPASMVENPELKARFLREGEAMARIRHPHVVDVYDVGVEGGIAYLVMEYLDGEDLGGRLKREKPLTDETLSDIMLAVCSAVSAAHDQSIIHRDLKPANIFLILGPHGDIQPKVLDFGISKIVGDPMSDGNTQGLTNTGAVLGTPYYMSPEQAHGGMPLDQRSDEYSLGVILYQCSTGQRPFDAPSMYQVLHKIVQGQFDRPAMLRPTIPQAFENVILKAMSKTPGDRFPSVKALGGALLPFASPRGRALWEPVFGASAFPTNPSLVGVGGGIPPAAAPSPKSNPTVAPLAEPEARTPMPSYSGTSYPSATTGDVYPAPSRAPLYAGIGIAVVAVLGAGAFMTLGREPEQAPLAAPLSSAPLPTAFQVTVDVIPAEAQITIDGEAMGRGKVNRMYPKDGREHQLSATAEGYLPLRVIFRDAPPSSRLELERVPVAATPPTSPPPPAIAPPPPVIKAEAAAVARPPPAATVAPTKAKSKVKTERGANNSLILE